MGTIAAYSRKGDIFRFYEINPAVESIQRQFFYYLSESLGKTEVIIGDGRLSLEREPDQQFDLLVIDAFSGDSIPTHLLTMQAFQLYFRHLKGDGILAIHISNKHLDLAPVVQRLCDRLNKKGVLIEDINNDEDDEIFSSDWVLISSDKKFFQAKKIKDVAKELPSRPDIKVWTDDYNNLFQILK